MQFFQSFFALGYSAINLLLVWLVIVAVLYRVLTIGKRNWVVKLAFAVAMLAILVPATNFLASENQRLNDAIRQDGGLKRTQTK